MNGSARKTVISTLAIVCACTCISLLTGCFASTNPNQDQTQSEQDLNQTQTIDAQPQEEMVVADEGSEGTSTDEPSAMTEAEGLRVDERDGFALWSRGKLSVSSGGVDDELIFEVDPDNGRTRAWTSLQVDGDTTATGTVSATNVDAVQSVSTENLEASDVKTATLESDSLESADANIKELVGVTMEAATAKIESMVVVNATLDDLETNELSAANVVSDSATIDDLESASAEISELICASADFVEMWVDTIHAGSVETASVSSDTMTTRDLDAVGISAKSIAADNISGTLSAFHLAPGNSGIVEFESVAWDGSGACSEATIEVPSGTDAVFLSPSAADIDFISVWEVAKIDDATWQITRRVFSNPDVDMDSDEDLEQTVGPADVSWIAVSFE